MKLHQYITDRGLTFQTFGEEIGVTGEAVRLWAIGGRTPRPKHMNDIAIATDGNVQPNDFF